MTRRPRRDRPPLLPDTQPVRAVGAEPVPVTVQARLVANRVAGSHPRLGRAEVAHAIARLVAGAPDALLGVDLESVDRDEAWDALADCWGCPTSGARVSIDPSCTVAGFATAVTRLYAVSSRGGRIALATSRPASLLPLYTRLADHAAGWGAELLTGDHFGSLAAGRRSLWWHDGVAVVTDGAALLADDALTAGSEWLFAVGRPDLVIADHGFAGAALAAGHETIAVADLDTPATAVAAARGLPVRMVPLHDGRPPPAYLPLLALVDGVESAPLDGVEMPPDPHGGDEAAALGVLPVLAQMPHSTTPTPGAYAPPTSGGEG